MAKKNKKKRNSKMTFAEKARQIHKKYKGRENDPLAKEALKREMERLREKQEAVQVEKNKDKKNIQPNVQGLTKLPTGGYTSPVEREYSGSPALITDIPPAQAEKYNLDYTESEKFLHPDYIEFPEEQEIRNYNRYSPSVDPYRGEPLPMPDTSRPVGLKEQIVSQEEADAYQGSSRMEAETPVTEGEPITERVQRDSYPAQVEEPGVEENDNGLQPYRTPVNKLGLASSAIGGAYNFLTAGQGLEDIDDSDYNIEDIPTLDRMTPRTLSTYAQRRDEVERDTRTSDRLIKEAAGVGGSRGGYFARTQAGRSDLDTRKNKVLNDLSLKEDQYNAQELSRTDKANADISAREAQLQSNIDRINASQRLKTDSMNRENRLLKKRRQSAGVGSILSGINQYGQDLTSASRYDTMIDLSSDDLDLMMPEDLDFWQKAGMRQIPTQRMVPKHTKAG